MYRLFALTLMLALAVPFGLRFATVLNYAVQFDYYKEVLCENKANPTLKCNGACQLAKELRAEPVHSEEQPLPESYRIEIGPMHHTMQSLAIVRANTPSTNKLYPIGIFETLIGFSFDLNKPPTRCIC